MGSIDIKGEKTSDGICLIIRDTGIGMNASTLKKVRENLVAEHAEGFGMSAVYKRLMLMYGERCSFVIDSKEGEGTTVTITIGDKDRTET